ncbi:type III secretion system needle length determinant [Pseudomonas entomophila]|uniref:type III secretion system needle length determinant n=1 Tax=Pseudomonas entomophila TaxID=312306 RepID=UPI001F00DC7A|nr:type III secretion system needle length determinant [Pseudomonas entomophila]MCG8291460.1 type III secretion system needle length determinant [Pseudomonas entomophila]
MKIPTVELEGARLSQAPRRHCEPSAQAQFESALGQPGASARPGPAHPRPADEAQAHGKLQRDARARHERCEPRDAPQGSLPAQPDVSGLIPLIVMPVPARSKPAGPQGPLGVQARGDGEHPATPAAPQEPLSKLRPQREPGRAIVDPRERLAVDQQHLPAPLQPARPHTEPGPATARLPGKPAPTGPHMPVDVVSVDASPTRAAKQPLAPLPKAEPSLGELGAPRAGPAQGKPLDVVGPHSRAKPVRTDDAQLAEQAKPMLARREPANPLSEVPKSTSAAVKVNNAHGQIAAHDAPRTPAPAHDTPTHGYKAHEARPHAKSATQEKQDTAQAVALPTPGDRLLATLHSPAPNAMTPRDLEHLCEVLQVHLYSARARAPGGTLLRVTLPNMGAVEIHLSKVHGSLQIDIQSSPGNLHTLQLARGELLERLHKLDPQLQVQLSYGGNPDQQQGSRQRRSIYEEWEADQ